MFRTFLCAVAVAGLMMGAAEAAGVMIVRHEVANYAKWRPVFDADSANQLAAGLTNPRVYQAAGDPGDVTILFDMADLAKAQAFGASDALKAAMMKAGVTGKPEVSFLNPAP